MAEQLEFFPVASPCRGICQSDERGFCRGCMRSRDERFNWQKMSDAEKQNVLRLCRQRFLRKIRANKPLPSEDSVIAQELNASSIEQVVYAWILRLPSQPLPIIGSGKIERVRAALEAETLSLSRQQWFRIRKAALGYDVP
ncbi:DUF1289 domain-containing protein [Salmonella enterica]|nr:DUF1289 domain-containing protein [Salmonella enterica]